MKKFVQPNNDVERGALALARVAAQARSSAIHRGHGRLGDQEWQVRSLQLALKAKEKENERWQTCVEALIESLDEGIVVTDGKGRLILLNHQAERILGISRSQIRGKSLHRVWNDGGMPAVPFSAFEHQGRVLQGHEILIPDRAGFPSGIIRILCDVTRMAEVESQLKAGQRLAAVGEMVGRVAHEIRNPLGSIELFASLLGSTTQNEAERHRLAEQISTVVRTLDQLLSNFLVISGSPRRCIQSVSLEKLLQETVLMAMPSIRQRAIVIQERLDPGVPAMEADEMLMKQGLLNILLNAIQASPQGGTIEIASRYEEAGDPIGSTFDRSPSVRNSPFIAITVRDRGGGIAPEDQPRLFDPFFSKRKGGTGLGLAIVQQVMEAHGGWVDCESQLGKGTTLQLCFPQRRKIE